jgi:hypothetical protein
VYFIVFQWFFSGFLAVLAAFGRVLGRKKSGFTHVKPLFLRPK